MRALGRFVYGAMIPLNILLYFWLAFGRGFFGLTVAWLAVTLMLFGFFPAIGLGATTWLAYRRRATSGEARVRPVPAWAHVVMWTAMLIAGFTIADVGDTALPTEDISIVDHWLGHTTADDLTWPVALVAILVAVVAWLVALVALAMQPRRLTTPGQAPLPPPSFTVPPRP